MEIRVITQGKPENEWGKQCQKACDDLARKGKSSIILSTEEVSPGKVQGMMAMTLIDMNNPTLIYGLARSLIYTAKRNPKVLEVLKCIIDLVNIELSREDEKEKTP